MSSGKLKKEQAEANRFAVHLLVPEEMLEKDLKSLGYYKNEEIDVKELGEKYGISMEAMTYALIVHGFK
jgi:Zn-dependent peptidase ImmA (M78 family)